MINFTENDFLELNDEILKRGNYFHVRIKGKSMEPFLRYKEVVIIKRFKPSDIRPGDIVFYRVPPSQRVIHRIIKITSENGKTVFITKGDTNFYFDPYVYPEDILGKIVAIERNGQYIKLDTFISKLKAIFYVKSFLINRWIYLILNKVLGTTLRKLQSMRIYSYLAKRFIRGKVTYRIATDKDAFSLAQLFKIYRPYAKMDTFISFFRKYLKDLVGSGYCILAEYRDRVVGSVTSKKFPEDGTLFSDWQADKLFVNWRYRRMGIGERLMKIGIKKAIENGTISVKVIVSKDNIRIINLLKKLGFHQIKRDSPKLIVFELNKSDITYEL